MVIWEEWVLRNFPPLKCCMRGKLSSERICSFLETKQISLEKESVKASISLTTLAHESSESNDFLQSVDLSLIIGLNTTRCQLDYSFPIPSLAGKLNDAHLSELFWMWAPAFKWRDWEVSGNLPWQFRSEQKSDPWRWWVCWWLSTFLGCRYPQYFLRRLASSLLKSTCN